MVEQMLKTGEYPTVLKLESMILEAECKHADKTIVKYDDYQTIMQMREVIFNDRDLQAALKDCRVEMSIICEVMIDDVWYGIKIRPDIITGDRAVPDYKTTADMNPEKFGKQAHDAGYWLKMALQKDVLEAVFKKSSNQLY